MMVLDTATQDVVGFRATPPHMHQRRSLLCSALPLRVDTPNDIPPSLPAFLLNTAEAEGDWFAVSTAGGGEFPLARDLGAQGIPYYLPLAERVVYHGRGAKKQRRKRLKPLFDHYIFVCGATLGRPRESAAEIACIESKYIDGPDGLLYESNQRALRNALENIEHALKIDPSLNVVEVNRVGQKVIVMHGPMKHTTGTVDEFAEAGGTQVVYLEIKMLGRAVRLEVPREFVAPI